MSGLSHAPVQGSSPLIIVATTGTVGDIQPFIALALSLQDRGHRVRLVLPRFHEAAAQASGLPFEGFGTREQVQDILDNPDLWDERKGWGVIWRGLIPHLDVLHDVVQRLPLDERCVVLAHPFMVPMAAMALALRPDLQIVAAYLAPSSFCSSHDMMTAGSWRIPRWTPLSWKQALWRVIHKGLINPITLPSLNAVRAQHKLAPVGHFFEHILHTPDASLGLFPEWLAAKQPDWPQPCALGDFPTAAHNVCAPAKLSTALDQFLSEGDRPIVFTLGTGHQHASRYFAAALEALRRLGRRGLFVSGHADQLPNPLPDTVKWQAYAPFDSLFPCVAAVVHHGGIGTMAEAFRAGVPQLVMPFAYDQFDNALRAQRLGVGGVLLAKRVSARRLSRQLEQLLASESVRGACNAVAKSMKPLPNAPRAVDLLEKALGIGPCAIDRLSSDAELCDK